MKIVVLSPHRDDAAFSLTLTVKSFLRAGHHVSVLNCFTRSNYAPFADTSFVHENDCLSFISALRQREDEAWRQQQASASLTLIDLHLKDAPLRLRCPLDDLRTREINPADKATPKIRKTLDDLQPDALVLPLALGDHVDHRTARNAAMSPDHSLALAFYEDLPYAAWPGMASGIEPRAEALGRMLDTILKPTTTGAGVKDAAAEKFRAALCYDSQIDTSTAHLLADFSERYSGAERLWVNEAWHALHLPLTSD